MSGNEDGVKMVRYAAAQIENLCPQVINAARILAARPRSKVAQENMDVFRDAWENQVRVLTEAVDDITTIDDFLAVSGMILSHVLVRYVVAWNHIWNGVYLTLYRP
jgi:catenin alpha